MTDLEICKRIAEIEGEFTKCKDWSVNMCAQLEFGDGANWKEYNPLKDKALCFDLIEMWVEELGIDIHRAYKEHTCTYAVDTGFSVIFNGSLAKAACLARIEINKRGDRI